MAEKHPPATGSDRAGNRTKGSKAGIDRRRYLRAAGATLGGFAMLGGARRTRANHIDTRVNATEVSGLIRVPAGEGLQVHVGANGYGDYGDLENTIIDITANGADAIITTHGGSWVIRNVAVRGESNGSIFDRPMISAKNTAPEETGLIENVYLGDGGDHGGHGPGRSGIHVSKRHAGTITVRNLNVQNWTDNGVYGSSPGKSGGGGGEVHIENCYGKNNNINNFRIGTPGSFVRDCVSVAEGTQRDLTLCRGVWCRHQDDMLIENTDIDLSGPSAGPAVVASKGGSVTYRNSEFSTTKYRDFKGSVETSDLGTNPSTTPPEEVPLSASAVLADPLGPPDSSVPTDPGTFTISGRPVSGSATYEFTVDGDIAATGWLNSADGISGSSASGRVNSGADSYRIDGPITDFSADGPVALYMGGQPVATNAPNLLEVSNRGLAEPARYRLGVGGAIGATDTVNITDGDSIQAVGANGRVNGGADAYCFAGDIEWLTHDGPVELFVNGRALDPDDFPPARELRIVGTGPRVEYEFTASGAVGPTDSLNSADETTLAEGSGTVVSGTDTYRFAGEITDFTVSDGASIRVYVDDERVDPYALGTRRSLRIAGRGERVEYDLTVSGAIETSAEDGGTTNPNDTIDDFRASGFVESGADAYDFKGEIDDLRFDRPDAVSVFVDGERVDPGTLTDARVLTIEGTGNRTTYDVSVTEHLMQSTANGASINDSDSTSEGGSRATGRVNGGTDSYLFDGEVEYLSVDSERVRVSIDGDRVDPDDFPLPNEIRVSNRAYDRSATYRFSVEGSLEPTGTVNFSSGDEISGSSADGRVNGGADTYRFVGAVNEFSHNGPVDVFVNGEQTQ